MLITYHGLHEEEDIQNIWWFQDGAPPHRIRDVTQRLRTIFRHNLVALHQDLEWPARSPDLTPLDFFLCRVFEEQSVCHTTKRYARLERPQSPGI